MQALSHFPSVAVVLLSLGLVTAGCGSRSGSPSASGATTSSAMPSTSTSSPAAARSTITIKDFAFGDPLTVEAGSTVTVRNADDTAHTVSAADGSFDTMPIFAGASKTFTATMKAGSYKFHCNIHANMQGTLIVTG